LITIDREPTIAVGLMSGAEELAFALHGEFVTLDGKQLAAGHYRAYLVKGAAASSLEIADSAGRICDRAAEFVLSPVAGRAASFTIEGITIGIDFHWQRKEDQQFQGALRLKLDGAGRLLVINEVAVESYLSSVISSEMSATAHPELLKAHAVISRSWLLAQLKPWKVEHIESFSEKDADERQLIRWYNQESHTEFDVCADDHCQRYQGISRATSPTVFEAIRATWGEVLVHAGALCDTRFSKCCGGMTEEYRTAWEDLGVPYLAARYDGESFPTEFALPLTDEANATRWIVSSPPAFCNTSDRALLLRILPDFDQETKDFYRWQVSYEQEELSELLRAKLGVDFGLISKLEPVERGASGRLVRLRIVGEKETLVIGKELEIRRALSPSHLYSSAFVVATEQASSGWPEKFILRGAGWGHGVGLCQIGAALMAEGGYNYRQILAHYYADSRLHTLYPARGGRGLV
jgi:SpoIID/LytB domain protein